MPDFSHRPPPGSAPLHIIEPTLVDSAGHCLSLVHALAQAAVQIDADADLTIWAGQGAAASLWSGPGRFVPHFERRWRKAQAWALYRRLLRGPGRLLVSTAGSIDLLMADWAATGRIAPHTFHAFVHWLNPKPGRERRLAALARRQPDLEVLVPTAAVAEVFRRCGFRTTQVPYPLPVEGPTAAQAGQVTPFRTLLVAGGARIDKGIDRVADLVDALSGLGRRWPIVVQSSFESRQGDDAALARQLERLRSARAEDLVLRDDTPDAAAYRAMFEGAVVLQPYRAEDFRDRVSGVTLDALAAAAPVVVTAGTWMARLVERFGAGVATDDLSPAGLARAIDTVLADHAGFSRRALEASTTLRREHSAVALMSAVMTGRDAS